MFGKKTVNRLIRHWSFRTVLDVGSGVGNQARLFEDQGKQVTQTDYSRDGDFMGLDFPQHDLVFACHILEHQLNVNAFLKKCKSHINQYGLLAVIVPPSKHEIVGGHLTTWNAGLLIYNLILAGFDCSGADVSSFGYNISVIVRNSEIELPELNYDRGDITKLQEFFPEGCKEGFDGRMWC